MTPKKAFSIITVCIALVALFLPGCSDKTLTTTEIIGNPETGTVAYLPLVDGWRVSYVYVSPQSGRLDIEVTDPVMVAGNPGFAVRMTDPFGAYDVTIYRYAKGDAIFESITPGDPGVRILEAPYVIGNSWDRNDTSTSTSVINDPGTGTETNDGGVTNAPGASTSYSTMSIVSIEDVRAMNDMTYGNCIKVIWQTGPSTCNYYWYAAGIGLVKFEEDVNLLNLSAEHTVGVMTDYQQITN